MNDATPSTSLREIATQIGTNEATLNALVRGSNRPFSVIEKRGIPVRTLKRMSGLMDLRNGFLSCGRYLCAETEWFAWFTSARWEDVYAGSAFDGFEDEDVLDVAEASAITGLPFGRAFRPAPIEYVREESRFYVPAEDVSELLAVPGRLASLLVDGGLILPPNAPNSEFVAYVNGRIQERRQERQRAASAELDALFAAMQ